MSKFFSSVSGVLENTSRDWRKRCPQDWAMERRNYTFHAHYVWVRVINVLYVDALNLQFPALGLSREVLIPAEGPGGTGGRCGSISSPEEPRPHQPTTRFAARRSFSNCGPARPALARRSRSDGTASSSG